MPQLKTKSKTTRIETAKNPTDQKTIQETAYYRWLEKGASHGADWEDWFWAEHQMEKNIFDRDAEP
jgi:hypothetical protein